MKKGPRKDTPFREFGLYGSLGITMVMLTAGGYYLGYLADEKFGTSPYLSLCGFFIGISAGFYQLFKIAMGKK